MFQDILDNIWCGISQLEKQTNLDRRNDEMTTIEMLMEMYAALIRIDEKVKTSKDLDLAELFDQIQKITSETIDKIKGEIYN
jgi:hypothetical protein